MMVREALYSIRIIHRNGTVPVVKMERPGFGFWDSNEGSVFNILIRQGIINKTYR